VVETKVCTVDPFHWAEEGKRESDVRRRLGREKRKERRKKILRGPPATGSRGGSPHLLASTNGKRKREEEGIFCMLSSPESRAAEVTPPLSSRERKKGGVCSTCFLPHFTSEEERIRAVLSVRERGRGKGFPASGSLGVGRKRHRPTLRGGKGGKKVYPLMSWG